MANLGCWQKKSWIECKQISQHKDPALTNRQTEHQRSGHDGIGLGRDGAGGGRVAGSRRVEGSGGVGVGGGRGGEGGGGREGKGGGVVRDVE